MSNIKETFNLTGEIKMIFVVLASNHDNAEISRHLNMSKKPKSTTGCSALILGFTYDNEFTGRVFL